MEKIIVYRSKEVTTSAHSSRIISLQGTINTFIKLDKTLLMTFYFKWLITIITHRMIQSCRIHTEIYDRAPNQIMGSTLYFNRDSGSSVYVLFPCKLYIDYKNIFLFMIEGYCQVWTMHIYKTALLLFYYMTCIL